MSERAQKIFTWIKNHNAAELPIRQQTLAELFGCSRRSIGRALNELKQANLLVDLNKRHESRCKIYEFNGARPNLPLPKGEGLTPHGDLSPKASAQGEQQLKLYRQTFEINFRNWPDWEKYYAQVTRELPHELNPDQLFRQTFDKLYMIRDRAIGQSA